jgi:hypothetical protein
VLKRSMSAVAAPARLPGFESLQKGKEHADKPKWKDDDEGELKESRDRGYG